MKIGKILIFIFIAIFFGFNIKLLLMNGNNKVTIEQYQQEIGKLNDHQREDFLRKEAFDLTIKKNHLLSNLGKIERQFLDDKRFIIYVPKNACGVCLKKLLDRYWDDYVSKIADMVLVYYENPNLNNTYYIGEKLINHKKIKEHKFGNENLLIIFFLDNNQNLLNLYLFDVNHIESFEPYIKSFCDVIKKN